MKHFITITLPDSSQKQLSGENLPLIIGSSSDADIFIADSDPTGAYIGDSQGHLFVQPSETNSVPIFHNNHHLTDSRWLKSNDQLVCGKTIISFEKKGDRLFFLISKQKTFPPHQSLRPPVDPPPEPGNHTARTDSIPININNRQPRSRKKMLLVGALLPLFIVLGLSALFVLIARPLELDINPVPDSVTIDGFPPAIKFGDRYLCIPGNYSIHIEKQGYYPFEKEITCTDTGTKHFSAQLRKLPGILALNVTPKDGISIYSDNEFIDTTPPHSIKMEPGNHQIKLVKERYQPFVADLTIKGEGKLQTLDAVLIPDWAEVLITSVPPGAEIVVDDNHEGVTPLTVEILSGTHQLLVRKEQYVEFITELSVTAGVSSTHDVQLQLLPSKLELKTIPEGAAVTVDGTYHGTTPVTLSIAPRSDHEIVLTSPGHQTTQEQVHLEPGETAARTITLEQETGIVYLTTYPPGATLTINGKPYRTRQGRLALPATKQAFTLSSPGYKTITKSLVPRIGFSQQLTIELVADTGNTKSTTPASLSPPPETGFGQKLLLVKPSSFTMGAPRREPGRRANERERTVMMKRPFYLSEKLVTNADYRNFDKNHNSGTAARFSLNDDSQPVVNLSWEDAVKYLNWLSARENLTPFYTVRDQGFVAASPPTNGYRLPTEAEWAYAARQTGSKTQQRFPWNGTFPPRNVLGNYGDAAAVDLLPRIIQGYNDSFPVSSPVGSFPPNKNGFFDLGGNVAEWCHDYYTAHASTLNNLSDPLGPDSGMHRVIRGSSWRDATITELRLSYRAYHREPRDNVGFRIARYQ